MTIKLPPEWERFIADKVKRGEFATASDVIREGLQLLRHHERDQGDLEALRREIALGIADDEAGKVAPFIATEDATRNLAELLADMRETSFTPPPGFPSTVELIREDRDR